MPETVLIVEDDPSILRGLQMNLGLEGFRTICAHDGEEALALLRSHKPDLVLLDLMLPKLSGLEVIKTLRATDPDTPIIVLSAKDQEGDKVLALSLGADDYVTKPFSVVEVIARIRVALRRRRRAKIGGESGTRFGVVELDVAGRRILVEGNEVDSTAREFDLLLFLHSHPGTVFSREQLMQQVWGPNHFGTVRTVDNFIARLRAKIEDDPDRPKHIETVRGVGYRFNP
ncbi:MAG TPA: response regulator transcription factor [Polyangia bacterium]|jgi:DNA-binding response OmpR family regulator|nr:response regulator transcription factor [Polyangia bacterium]